MPRARTRLRPPQHRFHSRHELSRAERLDHVVVGAHLQSDDAVGLLAARGEHDDRHVGVLAEYAADLEAVEDGEHQVEHDEVRVPVLRDLEGVGPVGRDGGVVPFELQVSLDDLRHNAFVVHDENSSRHDVVAPVPRSIGVCCLQYTRLGGRRRGPCCVHWRSPSVGCNP